MVSGISGFSSFSTASMSELKQKLFSSIDTNGDGSIAKDEATSFVQKSTASLVEGLFSSVDSDSNSLISKIEFDSTLSKLAQQTKDNGAGSSALSGMPPPPDQVFDTADANGDDAVTIDELGSVLGTDNAEKIFSKVDTNGDGTISRAEDETFRTGMTESKHHASESGSAAPPPPDQVFDTADTNKDGVVTVDELAAVLGKDNTDKIFSKVDTDGNGQISKAEDEAFLAKQDQKAQSIDLSGSDSSSMSSTSQGWQGKLYLALLTGLSFAQQSAASGSTSLVA